jgi:hypothetical protein
MTGLRTPPRDGRATDDSSRTTPPPSFGRFDGLGVEVLKDRLQRAHTLLLITRQSPMFHHPGRPGGWRTLVKQVLEIMEGDG